MPKIKRLTKKRVTKNKLSKRKRHTRRIVGGTFSDDKYKNINDFIQDVKNIIAIIAGTDLGQDVTDKFKDDSTAQKNLVTSADAANIAIGELMELVNKGENAAVNLKDKLLSELRGLGIDGIDENLYKTTKEYISKQIGQMIKLLEGNPLENIDALNQSQKKDLSNSTEDSGRATMLKVIHGDGEPTIYVRVERNDAGEYVPKVNLKTLKGGSQKGGRRRR